MGEKDISAAEERLTTFVDLLPQLYGDKSCTLNAHSLLHLPMFVRKHGPLWTHSLFGFESLNGHINSMILSKIKVAEQVEFSLNLKEIVGSMADRLVGVEEEKTLELIAPLSSLMGKKRRGTMKEILPGGYYNVDKLRKGNLSSDPGRRHFGGAALF